ncbi:hypothetical protein [Roseixanthobacter pseudopolyaromaticivorans]
MADARAGDIGEKKVIALGGFIHGAEFARKAGSVCRKAAEKRHETPIRPR